mgnify:FL=1|tara:strand:- start:2661 stop:3956 length:1296 start_codon:yes stop_codon:yes gene_type:complete
MAVKFGMTVVEIIGQLTRGFMKVMGRKPDGLEKIKIQQEAVQRFKDMNKVVDLEGNVIDTSKGIMGGQQVGQKGMFDNIFARMQSQMGKNIKEVKNKKQSLVEEAIDDASPGFSGDRNVDAELVAENLAERMGLVYDDMPTKERIKLYDEAYQGLTRKKFTPDDPEDFAKGGMARIGLASGTIPGGYTKDALNYIREIEMDIKKSFKKYKAGGGTLDFDTYSSEAKKAMFNRDIPTFRADGGRIGYKIGSLDKARRAFLKKAAGIGGGIAALKTGLLGLSKKAPETIETVKETVKQAPDYFFALVDKIKRLGTMVDDAVADPRMERTYRYKNYELRENAYGTPDETVVTKIDDRGEFGYKEESMVYKKGGMTEEGRVADEYEEFTVRPDEDGKLKDIDTGIDDVSDIIKEATDQAPSIKKAGGGLAYMLGE